MSTVSDVSDVSSVAPEASDLLRRARDLVPALRERARLTEDLRRIPDETMEDLHASGLLQAFTPRSAGGLGCGVDEFGQAIRILAHGCASTAWVYGFLVGHNVALVQDARHLLRGKPFVAAAATAGIQGNPAVTARPVDGGWRVTGTWKFASGVMNAEYILLITLQDNGDADPSVLGLISAVPDGRVEDVWHFAGMRGTGSNDFILDDVFIPTDHQWGVWGMEPLNPPVQDSGMNVSIVRLFDLVLSAVAVGSAEAALMAFKPRVLSRMVGYGQGPQREHREAWARYSDAVMRVKVARLLWDDLHRTVTLLADERRPNTVEEGALARLSGSRICDLARDALRAIADGSGSSVHHLDNPLQRQLRDVDTLKSHATLHWDAAAVTAGEALLGLADPVDNLVLG